MRYTDKVAIVTGAAGGIGSAIAARLASEGARLILADRSTDGGDQHVQAAKAAGALDAAMQACDVSVEDQVAACVKAALDRFGRVDLVVNNAGLMEFKPIEALTEEDGLKSLEVELIGPAYVAKHALLSMPSGARS